jgi:hypothetical protein
VAAEASRSVFLSMTATLTARQGSTGFTPVANTPAGGWRRRFGRASASADSRLNEDGGRMTSPTPKDEDDGIKDANEPSRTRKAV